MIPIQSIVDLTTLGLVVVVILVLIPYMYKQHMKLENVHTTVEKISKKSGKCIEPGDSTSNDTKESNDEGSSPPVGNPSEKSQSDDNDDTDPTYTDVSDSDVF